MALERERERERERGKTHKKSKQKIHLLWIKISDSFLVDQTEQADLIFCTSTFKGVCVGRPILAEHMAAFKVTKLPSK